MSSLSSRSSSRDGDTVDNHSKGLSLARPTTAPTTPLRNRHSQDSSLPGVPAINLHSPKPPPPVFGTPVHQDISSHHPFTSTHYVTSQVHQDMASELRGQFQSVGVEKLLDAIVPLPSTPEMPLLDPASIPDVKKIAKETAQYPLFINAMKPYLAPGWSLVDTSNHPDTSDETKSLFGGHHIKPDLTLYAPSCASNAADASTAECFGEFKLESGDEPFGIPPKGLEDTPQAGRESRGQIAQYSTAIKARQYRTRVFTFYVRRSKARLLSHSPGGIEVTPLFNWTKKPHLHKFFWRLTHADYEHRGHDVSFRLLTSLPGHTNTEPLSQPLEKAIPEEALSQVIDCEATARNRLELRPADPLYEVEVDGYKLYVSSPFTRAHVYPTGRATRCFAAYSPEQKNLVLLKHTWRDKAYDCEHEIYELLNKQQVENIPDLLFAGDIKSAFSSCEGPGGRQFTLYGIVLKVIGKPLESIDSSYHLIQVIQDVLKAHEQAFTKAQVLHRDLSVGNIIIVGKTGMLIDWERSLVLDKKKPVKSKDRTGTWQFLSVRLLENPTSPHEVQDDLESLIYILLWMAVRYIKNDLPPAERQQNLRTWFDYNDAAFAHGKKKLAVSGDRAVFDLNLKCNEIFVRLLAALMEALRYHVLPVDRWGSETVSEADVKIRKERLRTHAWMQQQFQECMQPSNYEPDRDTRRNEVVMAVSNDAAEPHNKRPPPSDPLSAMVLDHRKRARGEDQRVSNQDDTDDEAD